MNWPADLDGWRAAWSGLVVPSAYGAWRAVTDVQAWRANRRAQALTEQQQMAASAGVLLQETREQLVDSQARLDACLRERFGGHFHHWEHSLRVVDVLEELNLTADVRDGILGHSGRSPEPRTLEGAIVRVVDRVAYLNHDIDDALRAGVLRAEDLPVEPIAILGETGSARIDTLVHDLVERSEAAGAIVQGDEAGGAMGELRAFMFERVYLGPVAVREHVKVERVLRTLFAHYCEHPEELPDHGGAPGSDLPQRVTDYLAGMTDRYCIRAFQALTVPDAFAA